MESKMKQLCHASGSFFFDFSNMFISLNHFMLSMSMSHFFGYSDTASRGPMNEKKSKIEIHITSMCNKLLSVPWWATLKMIVAMLCNCCGMNESEYNFRHHYNCMCKLPITVMMSIEFWIRFWIATLHSLHISHSHAVPFISFTFQCFQCKTLLFLWHIPLFFSPFYVVRKWTTHFFFSIFFVLCIREKSTVIYSNNLAAAAWMMQFQKIFCIHNTKALFYFPLISIYSLEFFLFRMNGVKDPCNLKMRMNVTFYGYFLPGRKFWLYSSHYAEPNEFRNKKQKPKIIIECVFVCYNGSFPTGTRRYFTPINVP